MPDDKRTRSIRSSAGSPQTETPTREDDLGLIDTIAPTQDELIGIGATMRTPATRDDDLARGTRASENPDDADPSLSRGDAIGRYVVLELLGKGGMGEVYTAYDPELDRRIALKVIHAAVRDGGDPKTARERLLREAQTLAKLAHPNVVTVFDVGEVESHGRTDVYVAMEFVEGADLRGWLSEKKRSRDDILKVFIAAAEGLGAAHRAGLVHRDVKPDNILIGSDDRVRVIDFGIALQQREDKRDDDELVAELSASAGRKTGKDDLGGGTLVGTPAYMTPEQFLGGSAGGRSDQFSLCVALFEALSGERPFPGKTLPELSSNVLDNKRREITIGPQIPTWLAAALETGLAPDPEDRHADMQTLATALVPPQPKRNAWPWLAGLVVLVAAGGYAAYALGGRSAADEGCEQAADAFDSIWNETKSAEIETAFTNTNSRSANETFVRARTALDTYAKQWSGARIKTCKERANRQMTAATSEKKIACLETGLREFQAVTAVLATADAALVEQAVATASSMTPVERCSNLSRIIASPIVPPEIDVTLANVKALERAGRYKLGLTAADKAIEQAKQINSDLGRARALVWRGRLQSQQGLASEAVESLFEAVRLGGSIGDTYSQAHAWTFIVYVVGVRERKRLAALRWSKHAEVAITQDGAPLELEARRVYFTALSTRGLKRYEQALTEFRQAVVLAENAFGKKSLESSIALSAEAGTLRSLQRLDESVALYQRAIGDLADLLGDEHPKLASLHSNLGIVLVELHRYKEGRENYEKALRLKIEKLGESHPSVLTTRINLGVLEARLGNFEESKRITEAVHRQRLASGGDNYPRLPSTLLGLSGVEIKLGDLKEAEVLARRATDLFIGRGEGAHEEAAAGRIALCEVYRRQKRLASARRECEQGLNALRSKHADPRTLASALTEAARVALDERRIENAQELAEEAYEIRANQPSAPNESAHTTYVLAAALAQLPSETARARRLAKEATTLLIRCHVGERVLLETDLRELVSSLGE